MGVIVRLSETATDWTGQNYEERFVLCAQTLFIHGYLPSSDAERIENRIRRDADDQRCTPSLGQGCQS